MTLDTFAKVGGIFALLALLHFVADWVFQSHDEAMAKSRKVWVRARHCLVYTVICGSIIRWVFPHGSQVGVFIFLVLWVSHFLEDSYVPVYMWARYIRRPPEITNTVCTQPHAGIELAKFIRFAETPLGKILIIAIDQIVHLLFLVPVAVVLVIPSELPSMACASVAAICGLLLLNLVGKALLHR